MRKCVVLLAVGLALSGCATVTRGASENVMFDSAPRGAQVQTIVDPNCGTRCEELRNENVQVETQQRLLPYCMTPCSLMVRRNDHLIVTISKPGFESQTVKLEPGLAKNGALGVAGNVVAGGLTGIIIDSATGAAMDHCPNPLFVELRPVNARGPRKPVNMDCPLPPDPNGPIASYDPQSN